MKSRRLLLYVFAFLWLFDSCNKDASYDEANAIKQQASLLEQLETRVQVVGIQNNNHVLDIEFADGKHCLLIDEMTPHLTIGKDKCWSINGASSGVMANISGDSFLLPKLTVGDKGRWSFDGKETNVKASSHIKESNYKISYIAHSDHLLFVVLKDGSSKRFTIISDPKLIVPSYYLDVLREKEVMAMSTINGLGDNCASYIFFTDAHWGANYRKSPALIKHIVDYTGVSRVFFGGDVITSYNDSVQDALDVGNSFKRDFSFLGHNLYCLYGNHDDNSTGQPNKRELHLSEEQVYSYLQEQMTDVNYWNYYNFFLDDPARKTRYLCLDTGRLYYSQFRSFSVPTVQFIVESLQTVPDNWHIIVMSHLWCGLEEIDGIKKCRIAAYINPILKVFDDFNSRKDGVYSYASDRVIYDFKRANASISFCIGGHNHRDDVVYSDGGIPIIIVDTDSFKTINGETADPRTTSEQCVSIFVVDYLHNQLNIFRVGRGKDSVIQLY